MGWGMNLALPGAGTIGSRAVFYARFIIVCGHPIFLIPRHRECSPWSARGDSMAKCG